MFLVPAALVLALAIGYSFLWLYLAHRIEDGFVAWARVQTAHGNRIEYGPLAVSGFPGVVRLAIAAPRFTDAKSGWQWSSERADLEMRAWNWHTYRLDVFGTQQLAMPFAGAVQRLSVRSAATVVIAEADGRGRVSQVALQSDEITVSDPAGAEILAAAAVRGTTRMAAAKGMAHEQAGLDVTLQATSVRLGPLIEMPLGRQVGRLELAASIKGQLPDTLARGAVDAWRRDGGTVDLVYFHLDWGALDIRANGTVALDELLRPLGAASAEIRGYGETLAALEQARVLPRKTVEGSRFALDLLSRRDETDGRRVVTVPLSAQNGALFLGPVRMVRLEPIPFPAP
jgi:hypothetical protein